MAGHSKWANIKHRKASQDSKRGKIFTKLIKEITVAARAGGGEPDHNPRLRLLLDKARHVNMPSDNTTRAIKKGTGELPGVHYEAHMYEGYGPAGSAVLVEVLTDNKNRAVADLRKTFSRRGGNLGEAGSVSWMFNHEGVIRVKPEGLSEDDLLEALIDFDVEDISVHDDLATILCDKKQIETVRKILVDKGLTVESAELEWVAKDPVELDEKNATKVFDFLEAIEDMEDVQNVYSNAG
ncbi:YebC/PmpR family DNA-binding transcriptional regulator [bacterium]|jgi:YebC/PmpR family DNA-binding regulatory protein|nr:YebC/PmpR family DNA-binding transcriptional regulator [bacterium]MBT5015321.1 YebC/PmpR family DNA-binding transcriptional regulator [bacterium]